MRVTIKDIARELKISTSTVSRALADRWDVNPETRKAVLELAEKLNYRPNPISLNLKKQQSMSIGVVVPEFINSFFAEIMMGIQNILEPMGYHMLIMQSGESYDNELKNLRVLESKMVDGFIISITQETKNSEYFNHLLDAGFPLVFFNRICDEVKAPHVIIDDYKWSFKVVEHLIKQGYKRIAHLMGPDNLILSQKRKEGYLAALKKHNIPVDESLIIPCGIMMERGVLAAYTIMEMDERPDAIFAVNDPIAIGAMKVLQKNGIRVPQDIAIAGFSESQKALIIEPNLTSVEQPTFEIGQTAAELLLEQIKNRYEKTTPKCVILDAKLNIRESTVIKPKTSPKT